MLFAVVRGEAEMEKEDGMSEIQEPWEAFLAWERYFDPDFKREVPERDEDDYLDPHDWWNDDE